MSLSPESRAIIESARGAEDMSRSHRARLRGRVMAQVLTGAAITAGTSAATQVASAATISKIGAALVVAGAVGWGAQQALEPAPLPALGGSAYVVERATESAVANVQPKKETPVPQIAPAPPQPSAAPTASARTLSDEMALLQEAQRELQAGHADRALALLREHEQRYAAGTLIEEREAARVLALCRLGRTDEARAAAERFAVRFPRSPHRARVLTACAAR